MASVSWRLSDGIAGGPGGLSARKIDASWCPARKHSSGCNHRFERGAHPWPVDGLASCERRFVAVVRRTEAIMLSASPWIPWPGFDFSAPPQRSHQVLRFQQLRQGVASSFSLPGWGQSPVLDNRREVTTGQFRRLFRPLLMVRFHRSSQRRLQGRKVLVSP